MHITGVGLTPFTRRPERSLVELAHEAVTKALSVSGRSAGDIDEIYVGNAMGRPTVGAKLAEQLGFSTIPVTRVEQACASASTALRLACDGVRSGARQNVLVIGIDHMEPGILDLEDPDGIESLLSLNLLPTFFALKAHQYLTTYGRTVDELAQVSVIAKRAAAGNELAAYGGALSVADIHATQLVSDPLTVLHCCGNASGAGAAIVSADPSGAPTVEVLGWEQGFVARDPGRPPEGGWDTLEDVVHDLSARVYRSADIIPDEVDVVQVNDAFSICTPLAVEALGLAPRGCGLDLVLGDPGRVAINGDGGLLGRGHCLGATGLAMLHEIWQQLTSRAGDRQLTGNPSVGLMQSHGLGADLVFCFGT